MRAGALIGVIILGVVLLFLLSDTLFTVDETEQVVITQFGKPVGQPLMEPGLKFKTPFVQKVNRFDKRFLEWDGRANQIPTKDKRFVWVDTYARWRIKDPLLYFQRLQDERRAQRRLSDILDGETRNAVANHNLVEIVRTTNRASKLEAEPAGGETEEETGILQQIQFGRDKIRIEVLEAAAQRTEDLGIELIDVRFKRLNYVEEVRRKVYERMISERKRIAEKYRSEGAGEAARIRGEKERELKRISSEAYREAQQIIGDADAEATNVYAKAYSRDPEFYRFLKTMESYRGAIDADTLMVLSSESEFLEYLQGARAR